MSNPVSVSKFEVGRFKEEHWLNFGRRLQSESISVLRP